jgi:mannose-6-phosphate isomerase-like protein (cupin superfamily)
MNEACPGQSMNFLSPAVRSAQVVVPCSDLQATMDYFIERLGFRLEAIFPADAPATAVVSGHGLTLRLEVTNDNTPLPSLRLLVDFSALPKDTPRDLELPNGMKVKLVEAVPAIEVPEGKQEFVISRLGTSEAWGAGRATMQYRDLIPTRLGGRFVASHICVPEGGPVPDYVHYHRVRFQMIFCKAGWVRVVYEDQGPPFVMTAGDCVLQPPEIRHRVLEASPELEVIEITCPALHETVAEHVLTLPSNRLMPDRLFGGQRFIRHVAQDATWSPWKIAGFETRDTGIASATSGLAGAAVIRSAGECSGTVQHDGEFLFFFVLRGELNLEGDGVGRHELRENESCVIPAGVGFELTGKPQLELLAVALPGNLLAY